MAYDEDFANRIRELLAEEDGLTEMRMFGGLAFLLDGNMSVGISSRGGLMVRVAPEQSDELLAKPHTELFEMGGRTMAGWLVIEPEGVADKRGLSAWVKRGVAYARTLPAKG